MNHDINFMKIMKLLSDLHGSFPDILKKHNKYFFIGRIVKTRADYKIIDEHGNKIGTVVRESAICYSSDRKFHFRSKDGIMKVDRMEDRKHYHIKKITTDDMIKIIISEVNSWSSLEEFLDLEPIDDKIIDIRDSLVRIVDNEITYSLLSGKFGKDSDLLLTILH